MSSRRGSLGARGSRPDGASMGFIDTRLLGSSRRGCLAPRDGLPLRTRLEEIGVDTRDHPYIIPDRS